MLSILPFGFLFLTILVFGTLFSLSSVHWLGIWAGLEVNLIGFVPILVYQKSIFERESAVKYFIIQAIGSSLLIFGSLINFNLELSWNIINLTYESLNVIGVLVILGSLILKIGAFPFHYWFPGVITRLPWLSCLILVTWQKIAPVFLVRSLFESISIYWLAVAFCVLAGGSSLVGGIGGINQTQVRALLAYSSIGHLGWIMFSILFRQLVLKTYFYIYIIISLGIFLSLWYLDMKDIVNIKSVIQKLNYQILLILISLVSLGGLPPLVGFVSKFIVIIGSVSYRFSIILVFLIIGSLISLFYYLNLFFSFYFSANFSSFNNTYKSPLLNALARIILLFNFIGLFLLYLILLFFRV